MMQVTCDTCGKSYRVDENKIRGEKARLKCKACENIIVVSKPKPQEDQFQNRAIEPSVAPPIKETALEDEGLPLPSSRKTVRFGLFTKIIVVMLIVSLLPFIIFWTITFRETNTRIKNDTELLMTLTAQGLGTQVENWIDNNIWVLRSTAKLPAIISMNRSIQEPVLREVQSKYPYMYLVFTVALDGKNVARSDDVPLKDYSDRQYYKDIIKGKKLSWQTLIGKTSKKPALVLSVPIYQQDNLVGVMAAAMTIDEISKYVANWKKGQTGFAFLIDEKGKVVAHQRKQFVVTQKNLRNHPLIAAFRKGKWTTKTTIFNNDKGEPTLGHVRGIKYGWALAIQQDSSEVFEPLKRVRNFALSLLFVTVVLVSLIAYISARTIVRPIMTLTDVAERMSLGDLNMQINVPSKDEIGLLAQAIKRMQTSLRLAMERLRRKR
ncbi:MAG: cache domain-containing protein [Desulfobacterales bacterium]|jgi:methyl-accepting chemotaxis protein